MRKSLLHLGAAFGIAVAFSSCTDPYYASGGGYYGSSNPSSFSGYGGGYSGGYGDGYGYGSTNFSTSLFVSTGNSRWGYDPSCYSYYDYQRRSYYDPYLRGYYPVGYRPPVIIGCPHPHGWRPGQRYCPPPSGIRNNTVVNYRNRESSYRNLNHSWARNVRADYGNQGNRGNYGNTNRPNSFRPQPQNPRNNGAFGNSGRTPSNPRGSINSNYPNSGNQPRNPGFQNRGREATLPRGYNQPIGVPPGQSFQGRPPSGSRNMERVRPGSFSPAPPNISPTSPRRGFDGSSGANRVSPPPVRAERPQFQGAPPTNPGYQRGSSGRGFQGSPPPPSNPGYQRGSSGRGNESSRPARSSEGRSGGIRRLGDA